MRDSRMEWTWSIQYRLGEWGIANKTAPAKAAGADDCTKEES